MFGFDFTTPTLELIINERKQITFVHLSLALCAQGYYEKRRQVMTIQEKGRRKMCTLDVIWRTSPG
jgi:hypothetical protein